MTKLNSKEAIYGFCAWLTCRKEVQSFGSNKECGGISDLVEEFSSVNKLDDVTEGWHHNLIHPSGECSHINNVEI